MTEPEVKVKTVAEDERYIKFFKMLKMGVPLQVGICISKLPLLLVQAAKNKMSAEGLDPGVLDNPEAPAEAEEAGE